MPWAYHEAHEMRGSCPPPTGFFRDVGMNLPEKDGGESGKGGMGVPDRVDAQHPDDGGADD